MTTPSSSLGYSKRKRATFGSPFFVACFYETKKERPDRTALFSFPHGNILFGGVGRPDANVATGVTAQPQIGLLLMAPETLDFAQT